MGVKFSNDDKFIYSFGDDKKIIKWDLNSYK